MYYSFKPCNSADRQHVLTFIPQVKPLTEDEQKALDAAAKAAKDGAEVETKPQSEFIYLGKSGDLHYYFVTDDTEVVEQPAEINATKLDELPSEVAQDLAVNGEYALLERHLQGLQTMPERVDYDSEHNYSSLQAQITDLASVLSVILSTTPMNLDGDSGVSAAALNTLKKLAGLNSNVSSALSKVGL